MAQDAPPRWPVLAWLAGAGLLFATGAIHLDLYLTGYRTIPTIGWLFLLQVIAAFSLAVLSLVWRSRLLACAAALFSISTLGGYLLSIWVGLFGFREVRTPAGLTAGLVEIFAFLVFGLLAVLPREVLGPSVQETAVARGVSGVANGTRLGAVALLAIVAGALLASALATAPGTTAAAKGASVELKVRHIGRAEVLTNASGMTLYLFVPDTTTTSRCYGACAVYWPPVLGQPTAGPGVTGRLGTIRRSGGTLQATYDGHPLYTYISDSAPGQATGNAIDLNGGYWYEVTVTATHG